MARTMTDSLATYRTPLYADFLLAHSTVAGFYSWRNTVSGSWFIQVSLRKQLHQSFEWVEMTQILGEINRVVLCNRVNYYCITV